MNTVLLHDAGIHRGVKNPPHFSSEFVFVSLEPINIRRARRSDLQSIVDIWIAGIASGFGTTNFATEEALRFFEAKLEMQSEKFGIWVAMCGDHIVGWQALYPCRNNPIEAVTVAKSSTYVSPAGRGKGVGRALLVFAQQHAMRVQLKELRANICAANFASLRLVNLLGWSRVGTLPRIGDDSPTFLFYAYAVPACRQ